MASNQAKIVLNLGGEGEVLGAINLNLLVTLLRPIETVIASGPVVRADLTKPWPIGDVRVQHVVGNRLPMMLTQHRTYVAKEAYRVLRSGGTFEAFESSAGGTVLVGPLKEAGFDDVRLRGVFATGRKP